MNGSGAHLRFLQSFKICVFTFGFSALSLVLSEARDSPRLEDGDIVFQRSSSRQSQAIAAATGSEHTHVGIVLIEKGTPFVFEAVQPVKKTRLADWIRRGRDGRFCVRRLKDRSLLDVNELRREVYRYMGKDYDLQFGWSDSQIYCSELVWKAYQRSCGIEIGTLKHLRDFNLQHESVQQLMKQRYGSKIPWDMQVIAPADIFDSPLLESVGR